MFGLTEQITIQDSNVNVNVLKELQEASLICFQCNANITDSELIFVANARNISGLVLIVQQISLQTSFVQFRLGGEILGGISCSTIENAEIVLTNSNISGFNMRSQVNDLLVAQIQVEAKVKLQNVQTCTNGLQINTNNLLSVDGSITYSCDICSNGDTYSYGICQQNLDFGEIINNLLVCKDNFNECTCIEGYQLNGSECVNLIQITTKINQIVLNQQLMIDQKANNSDIRDLQTKINQIQESQTTNSQEIVRVDSKCQGLVNAQQQDIQKLTDENKQLKQQLIDVMKIVETKYYTIDEIDALLQQLKCPVGAKYVGNTCQCPQFSKVINGICTCPQHSFLQNDVCECPVNSQLSDSGCKCNIINQIISGGQCVCPSGSTFINSQCQCLGEMQLIQNECRCPYGQQYINNQCQCQINGAKVVNSFCSCPLASMIINGACVCPPGFLVIDDECQCLTLNSLITADGSCVCGKYAVNTSNSCICPTGSVLIQTQCECQTSNAFIKDNACICPINSTNTSSSCDCPIGSVLIDGVCKCSKTNAFPVNGVCVCGVNATENADSCDCPTGSTLIDGICKCTVLDSFPQAGSCQCGVNASMSGTTKCVCPTGSTLQNGMCLCTTINAFPVNKICKCGTNATNTSTTCVCPTGSILLDGICKCQVTNAFVSGSKCVCPKSAVDSGTSCDCPLDTALNAKKDECVCTQLNAQVVSGVCTCPKGADITPTACNCPATGQTSSVGFECKCPGNQVVISSACPSYSTLSGVNCVCPEGNLVDNLCVCNIAGAELTPASKNKCICTTPGSTMSNNIQCKCSVTHTGPTGTSRDQNYWCPDLKMCCTKLKNSIPDQLFICSDGSYQKACTGINTIVTRE
ncbi:Conserved_hypothetical protein [Hexamita inflata]|uniref:EGF-like domain-containing protein n=1 Tax=Hexamita inflata TaxID=28002 RepID=A0AA86P8L9_9EUKA|nr:Conserved hypothetical protein [Hexamita inflata]